MDLSLRAMYVDIGDLGIGPDSEDHREYTASLKQSLIISRNNMVRFDLKREKVYNIYQTDAVVSWNIFF